MHVDTMRAVDYWVGVPLCFVGSLLKKLTRFIPNEQNARPSNVLLVELSEMGSTILVDPAMQKLKRQLDANLHFVIFKKNKPSLDLLNTVPEANIFTIREDSLISLFTDTLRFFWWTRSKKIDTVIDLELFSRFTALLTGYSGASRRVGFHAFYNEGLYRGSMLTHEVAYNPHMHIAKNFIALVNALLVDKKQTPYSKTVIGDEEILLNKVTVTPEAQEAMRSKIKSYATIYDPSTHRVVLFNANASDLMPLRRWSQESYIQLARQILDTYKDVLILLTGAPAEFDGLQKIPNTLEDERCINFSGKTTFAELVALYEVSEFMLTNDSGPG
ncbi:MAG: glycosyltransferase family 9 protein, partial [Sulfuricurvum sp.]|nr:glycosyltransferase family 9 protein [Sulfuricurvum sp.]